MATDTTGELVTDSAKLPLAMAIVAWLSPLGFCIWFGTELGFHTRTGGIPDAAWFGLFGAIPGLFAAAASLLLIRVRTREQLPVAGRTTAKYLALALFVAAALAILLIVASRFAAH